MITHKDQKQPEMVHVSKQPSLLQKASLNPSQPVTTPASYGPDLYRLVKDFDYYYLDDIYMKRIRFPKGVCYDFASIPQLFWTLIGHPASPQFQIPSLCHDMLYLWMGQLPPGHHQVMDYGRVWKDIETKFTRAEIDKIFRLHLKEQGVGIAKRWAMWSAVRVGGAWQKDQKRPESWKDLNSSSPKKVGYFTFKP